MRVNDALLRFVILNPLDSRVTSRTRLPGRNKTSEFEVVKSVISVVRSTLSFAVPVPVKVNVVTSVTLTAYRVAGDKTFVVPSVS